jgi:hypothetical protein
MGEHLSKAMQRRQLGRVEIVHELELEHNPKKRTNWIEVPQNQNVPRRVGCMAIAKNLFDKQLCPTIGVGRRQTCFLSQREHFWLAIDSGRRRKYKAFHISSPKLFQKVYRATDIAVIVHKGLCERFTDSLETSKVNAGVNLREFIQYCNIKSMASRMRKFPTISEIRSTDFELTLFQALFVSKVALPELKPLRVALSESFNSFQTFLRGVVQVIDHNDLVLFIRNIEQF